MATIAYEVYVAPSGVAHAVRPEVHPTEGVKTLCGRPLTPMGPWTGSTDRITCEVCRRLLGDALSEVLGAALHPDERPRDGLEELYVALDAAIDATAKVVALAQALLPDHVSHEGFVALNELCSMKNTVNPGPSDQEPF